jgi:hypothetical protein
LRKVLFFQLPFTKLVFFYFCKHVFISSFYSFSFFFFLFVLFLLFSHNIGTKDAFFGLLLNGRKAENHLVEIKKAQFYNLKENWEKLISNKIFCWFAFDCNYIKLLVGFPKFSMVAINHLKNKIDQVNNRRKHLMGSMSIIWFTRSIWKQPFGIFTVSHSKSMFG